MTKKKRNHLSDETVINKIYHIRKQRVMLDKDLAELYGVKPTRLREQVKRNPEKFPPHFMFQLTIRETNLMVSQNAIPSSQHLGGHLPYAFTEHGVLMLANVLKSKIAIAVSLHIIEIFVKVREMLSTHKDILAKIQHLERRVTDHGKDIQMIFAALKKLLQGPFHQREQIGFKRQNEK